MGHLIVINKQHSCEHVCLIFASLFSEFSDLRYRGESSLFFFYSVYKITVVKIKDRPSMAQYTKQKD